MVHILHLCVFTMGDCLFLSHDFTWIPNHGPQILLFTFRLIPLLVATGVHCFALKMWQRAFTPDALPVTSLYLQGTGDPVRQQCQRFNLSIINVPLLLTKSAFYWHSQKPWEKSQMHVSLIADVKMSVRCFGLAQGHIHWIKPTQALGMWQAYTQPTEPSRHWRDNKSINKICN